MIDSTCWDQARIAIIGTNIIVESWEQSFSVYAYYVNLSRIYTGIFYRSEFTGSCLQERV